MANQLQIFKPIHFNFTAIGNHPENLDKMEVTFDKIAKDHASRLEVEKSRLAVELDQLLYNMLRYHHEIGETVLFE